MKPNNVEYVDKIADSKVEERDKSEQGEVDEQAMELGNLDKAVDERVGEGGKSEKD